MASRFPMSRTHTLALCALATLSAMFALAVMSAPPAEAAVTHEFLSGVSAKLNQGVPAVGPHGEAIALPGPFIATKSLTVDAGELYVGEGQGTSRIDKFDDASGAFLSQLPQIASPEYLHQGMTVGHSTGEAQLYVGGDVYPAGSPLGAVGVLSPAGALLGTWTGADTPGKAFACFECGQSSSIAVDGSSSLSDSAAGDVYVVDRENKVVDVFKPEAGGAEKYVTQLTGPEPPAVLFQEPLFVAVDQSSGTVFIAEQENGNPNGNIVNIFKPAAIAGQYEYAGKLAGPGAGGTFAQITALAVDGKSGDIYVGEGQQPGFVDQFNVANEYEGRLAGPPAEQFTAVTGIAVDPESHNIYVSDYLEHEGENVIDAFGPDILLPDAITEAPSSVEPLGAHLNGKVNPLKGGNASCEFVWGTSTALGQVAPCEPSEVVDGSSPVAVHATLTGLQSDTTYYYRLQATNQSGTNPGEPQDHEFTTPGPGLLASASDVASTSATLDATVNPHNHPTSYYFQYGKSTAYESEIPSAPGAPLGSGEGRVEVSNHIQGLSPDTVYHYRVVGVSELQAGISTSLVGTDETFTTHTSGTGFILPDNRQWELVSPSNKHGASIDPITEGALIQSALSGAAFTYVSFSPPEADPMGYFQESQIVSTRGTNGWSSQDISLPHRSATPPSLADGAEYRFFSEDLSQSLVRPWGEFTSLSPQVSPLDTESTPYLRHDFTCKAEPETCFRPLVTGAPGYADVPAGTQFGGGPDGFGQIVNFRGANADLTDVVLGSKVALTPTPVIGVADETKGWLYEWSTGKPSSEELQLISVLPENEGGAGVAGSLGYDNGRERVTRPALSADGSRIVWSTGGSEEGLYLRDTKKGASKKGASVRLDGVQQGASGKGHPGARFQIANSEVSTVLFTESRRLTQDSGAVGGQSPEPDLYNCDIVEVAGELQCKLSDLTPLHSGHSADVQGSVLGASENGAYVYFVASGVLTDEENAGHEQAVSGADNLYMLHRDSSTREWEAPRLVAVLSNEDGKDWLGNASEQTVRASPDGRYLAFMSNRSLTGYDTRDANSGRPDEEVYLFDANEGRVVCASCDPTGARPVGAKYVSNSLVGGDRVWGPENWLAANIPGWTPVAGRTAYYQSRYLSDEGRLFFNSSDALVSQDINGTQDVYEFEVAGVGSCTASSATFAVSSGGCIDLISSGTSPTESAFLDASGDGSDIFFLSAERLAPQDVDTSLDVYDAHVCSSTSPCSSSPVSSPACVTADACRAAPLPQPAAFGAPASSTFTGAGNVTPAPPGHVAKRNALTGAQKLARAMAVCHQRKGKRKRAACERQAKKRYGAGQSHKSNATKRGKG